MKILGIIPARGGSKGLPGKNKRLMLGKPLISYTIDAAKESNLTAIAVSSDDEDILAISRIAGIITIKRPEELSGDKVPSLPVLQHAVDTIGTHFDAVMTLQPTSPLRTTNHINEALELFKKHPDADSLVSIVQAPHKFTTSSLMEKHGVWVKSLEKGELILRRQEKPVLWGRNGAAIYITKIEKLSEYIFGGNILPYEMSKSQSVDIDDLEDWIMAEAILKYKMDNNQS